MPDVPAKPTYIGENIELPASFYLGREYDLAQKKATDKPVMYEARDLTTHGVVVGMTGSGKTGLCVNLLEEAAIDGIPCIIIDLKGDLVNLLLQFEDLKPDDFEKWINPEDARLKGLPMKEYAQQMSDKWRKGLADWGQTPERIKLLKDATEQRIYTPGSEAGLPLSILGTFAAPKTPPSLDGTAPRSVPREELNQKIESTTTALLGLTGISADPVQSREHILIAQMLLHFWTKGQDLDLPKLIMSIQVPPMNTIGAFDMDTFYPEKDRLKLAVALNNILAAPSFSTWIAGEPLDLTKLMSGGTKPRQIIFYLAHLEDSQRMFFLTLLLEEVLSWTRKQPGTSNLRAIVYFDEVFGYLPPYPANPPTKLPLMTLIKQARAFGVGLLLATQNPVDLDYKALS
ncbi:MAG: helicase HerA-like domain-containing protein, partial [Planctomycetia bacterium]|nr:helicase HerA-like domain-containing protein [Planctomycetia bacterium]